MPAGPPPTMRRMRRRPPTPAQVELPVTLVALAAAVAALVQALITLLVRAPEIHPHWARPAASGILVFASLTSLLLARLRAGPSISERVRALRWATLVVAVAAGGIALGAGLTAG
jgi:lysylphosphatidylglycerol synthetase-like protein (DUF2156 family)